MLRITARDGRRVEGIAQQPLAGTGTLDFGNHGRLAGIDTHTNGRHEIATRRHRLGFSAQRFQVAHTASPSHLGGLDCKDAFENIRSIAAHFSIIPGSRRRFAGARNEFVEFGARRAAGNDLEGLLHPRFETARLAGHINGGTGIQGHDVTRRPATIA